MPTTPSLLRGRICTWFGIAVGYADVITCDAIIPRSLWSELSAISCCHSRRLNRKVEIIDFADGFLVWLTRLQICSFRLPIARLHDATVGASGRRKLRRVKPKFHYIILSETWSATWSTTFCKLWAEKVGNLVYNLSKTCLNTQLLTALRCPCRNGVFCAILTSVTLHICGW